MSAVLGFSKGYSVSYLTGPVANGREGYYTGAVAAGEPPGQWWGAGARELGLVGEVDSDLMEAIYARLLDPRDPAAHERARWDESATLGAPHKRFKSPQELYEAALLLEPNAGPERRAELEAIAEKRARQPIAFFDMTFSPSKSVTVLSVAFERAANDARAAGDLKEAAAWADMNRAVEAAVMAGARASIDYLEEVAGYARVGRHGGGANRWGDANKFVVAQFLQHDSRDRDPQLHVHQAVLNKLQRFDGQWTGVDESALKLHRWSAGAIGERVMEVELARTLGVRFVPRTTSDGVAREIAGVDQQVMDLFSKRAAAVTAKAAEMIAAFEAHHGREASVLERKRISEQATLLTRKGKSHDGETNEQRLDRWERETRGALKGGLARVAHNVLAQRDAGPAETWDEKDVLERALAAVGKNQQTWTRSDLIFAVSSALPANLGVPTGEIRELLEGLADKALGDAVVVVATEDAAGLPSEFQLRNGLSAYQRPGSAKYTTPDQLTSERLLELAAVRTGAAQLTAEQAAAAVDRFATAGFRLGVDQELAVRGVLTSGAHVETITAAAGAGKSVTVGVIAEAWAEHGRRTFGLAASQNAADIMSEEGVRAFNIERWRGELEQNEALRLRGGDLVVVDEAGMASTQDLADIAQRCEAAGAKLLLVGDSHQLRSIGPGGALADIGAHAKGYELTEVRRFSHGWEGDASLRFRDGDASALDDYDKHGRLRACGTAEQAERKASQAWLADTLAGRRSLLLVGSNEAAARVNADLRAELVRLGKVEERGVALGREGTVAGVGDVVQARRNNWSLRTPVINRQTFRVTEALPDGTLRAVSRKGREVTLPADYVAQHVSLAYASTVHAAQGRTVDTAHGVIDRTDAGGAYVMLTRGRDSNTAWVVTKPLASDAPVGEAQEVEPRSAKAVLGDLLERAEEERGALAQRAQAVEDEKSTFRNLDRLIDAINIMSGGRTSQTLDHLAAEGVITAEERAEFASDRAMGSVERLLRHAEVNGHDPARLVQEALAGKNLKDARSVGQVLHKRLRSTVGEMAPRISSYRDLIPSWTSERWRPHLEQLAERADQRRLELGARVAEEQPRWATEALGPVPEDPLKRAVWESKAGWAAAHRENMEHDSDTDALGLAPPAGLPEKHAVWCTAHDALGLEVSVEEAMLTDGQLRVRVAAYEREKVWAPRMVADELAATNTEAAVCRTNASLWAAHAETLDGEEREAVAADARKAEARAEELELQALSLEEADRARQRWFAHTEVTRGNADRARIELERRGVDLDDTSSRVTAAEWLAEHRTEQAEDEHTRPVYDTDVAEDEHVEGHKRGAETDVADIRDVAVIDPSEDVDAHPRRQVPQIDATAASVARAREALLEIHARDEATQLREAEDAAEQAQQWLATQEADEHVAVRSA